MAFQKICTIPFSYPFFETYKESCLKYVPSDFFQSALFFVPYAGFKQVLIDFLAHYYPKDIAQTIKVMVFSETEEWEEILNEAPLTIFKPLKFLQRRHLMVELLLSLKKDFFSVASLNSWLMLAEEILLFFDDLYRMQKEQKISQYLTHFFSIELAHHRCLTLDYLQEVISKWPTLLQQLQRSEPLLYHRALIHQLLKRWELSPPSFPIVALGLGTTTPLTIDLLKGINKLDKGQLVFRGDFFSSSLEATHPCYSNELILKHLKISSNAVSVLVSSTNDSPLVSWILHQQGVSNSLEKITLEEYPSFIQQVQGIALILQYYYEHSTKKVAFITPTGDLMNSVMLLLKKRGIPFDCSVASPFKKTILAQLAWLSLSIAVNPRHSTHALAFWNFCQPYAVEQRSITPQESLILGQIASSLRQSFQYFSFSKAVEAHQQTLINLFTYCTNPGEPLSWEKLFESFEGFNELTDIFNSMKELSLPLSQPLDYEVVLEQSFQHPRSCLSLFKERICLLRPFESLFVTADLVILGDLNEGSWPLHKTEDIWFPPSLRKEWDLPNQQLAIGLEAQNFLNGCSAKEIILSRSLKMYGQRTTSSRWLLQLQIALKQHSLQKGHNNYSAKTSPSSQEFKALFNHLPSLLKNNSAYSFATLQPVSSYQPYAPPRPCPPLQARPRCLSVTAIEQWMRDPYTIYARHILQLKPIIEEKENSPAARGNFIHQTIEQWLKITSFLSCEKGDKKTAYEELLNLANDYYPQTLNPAIATILWGPRFASIAQWLVDYIEVLKKQLRFYRCEIKGKIIIGTNFTLTATADRIDWREEEENKGGVIIDYKTGRLPLLSDIQLGFSPQLPLEALIYSKGGFSDFSPLPSLLKGIEYWHLTGNTLEPGTVISLSDIDSLLHQTEEGIKSLITAFDNIETPYLSCPRPDKVLAWPVYDHLARRQEWS